MKKIIFATIILSFSLVFNTVAQDIERTRPQEWDNLTEGGAFIDLFEPIPIIGNLTEQTWGGENVIPRYTDNGIEERDWSYWGGNIVVGPDKQYHLFVCRWPENNEKGHWFWPNSEVVHAVSSNRFGPFKVKGEVIGKGYNPEIFQLTDGRFIIYVYGAYYISESLNGPWEKKSFDFDPRDRKIIADLSNLSFAKRVDGSQLMVCRGGGIWISKTGTSTYYQITNKSIYPSYEGKYEDPVIWKSGFQYHIIVNDWYGRIAYHLRSYNGVDWKHEPGEAYKPGIAKYTDGTVEDWYKYERIKILQDETGRAIQANFAVIDTSKWGDLGGDNHNSKNISIPLTKEKFVEILNTQKITDQTETIKVRIMAEKDFNPVTDVAIESLRFGASEEVNFGRGCEAVDSYTDGTDLIVVFVGKGNGLTDDNFAAKLLGKTKNGKLLIGYAKLPGFDYQKPILSSGMPDFSFSDEETTATFEIQNFGLVPSEKSTWEMSWDENGKAYTISGIVKSLKPYEKTEVKTSFSKDILLKKQIQIKINLKNSDQKLALFDGEVALD
jgi:hypothetical protein